MPKHDNLLWCIRQKRGIKLVTPNDNLRREYLRKARSSLNMLDAAVERSEADWIITTAYYARYFALYALLQKCGIKSEIHDCSIELLRLFVERGVVGEEALEDLAASKKLRIEAQYYVREALERKDLLSTAKSARESVISLEEAIERITEQEISQIRDNISKLRALSKKQRRNEAQGKKML